MKKLLFLLTITSVAIGCSKTTTTGPADTAPRGGYNNAAPRSGEGNAAVKKLTVTAANEQTINRGSTDKVLITINRDNFNDPVTISFSNLPQGIQVEGDKEMVIATGSNTLTVTLKADANATPGDYNVTINAKAPGLETNAHQFKLTIK
jgi:uncharacterized membrane protein